MKPYPKNKAKKDWQSGSEHLPSTHEVLSSNTSTKKKIAGKIISHWGMQIKTC
jgi:hypothetical protein